jgi:hypothetical protein
VDMKSSEICTEIVFARSVLYDRFLLGVFFGPRDGGDVFSETSVDFQRATRRYISEAITLWKEGKSGSVVG